MMGTKRFFIAVLLVVNCIAVQAQKVNVTKDGQRVKGNTIDGYSTEITGTVDEVTSSYTKYLKSFSKIKTTDKVMQLSEATLGQTKYTSPLYASVKGKTEKVNVWLGINPAEWPDTAQYKRVRKELETLVYNFGIKFYRDKVQVDIDEALRAQQTAEKQTMRLLNENKSLSSRLEFNQKEKIRLEKAIIDNKADFEMLQLNISNNKKSQDSLTIATDQIKKMVEIHKERQKKIN